MRKKMFWHVLLLLHFCEYFYYIYFCHWCSCMWLVITLLKYHVLLFVRCLSCNHFFFLGFSLTFLSGEIKLVYFSSLRYPFNEFFSPFYLIMYYVFCISTVYDFNGFNGYYLKLYFRLNFKIANIYHKIIWWWE